MRRQLFLLVAVLAHFWGARLASSQEAASSTSDCEESLPTVISLRVVQCVAQSLSGNASSTVSNQLLPLVAATPTGNSSTEAYLNLLDACFNSSGLEIRVLRGLAPVEAALFLTPPINQYKKDFGLDVQVLYKEGAALFNEVKFTVLNNVSQAYNVFVYKTDRIVDLYQLGVFADLNAYVGTPTYTKSMFDANPIHPFFRQAGGIFNGQTIGIPFVGYVPFMYWRKDVFEAHNISPPQTWEEALAVAEQLSTVDWAPLGAPKIPVCFNKQLPAEMGRLGESYLLLSILGSFTQYQGKQQGVLMDPDSLELLVNTPAMQRAWEVYLRFASLMWDVKVGPIGNDAQLVVNGTCAFGFGYAETLKSSPRLSPASKQNYLKGNLGMAPIPGSTEVWDRTTRAWRNCTEDTCACATPATVSDPATGQATTVWVNRAIQGVMGAYGVAFNSYAAKGYQEASYQFITYMGNALLDNGAPIFSTIVPFGPVRVDQLDPANASEWPLDVYNATDVQTYLNASQLVLSHPSTQLDLRMPQGLDIILILDDAARVLQLNGTGAIAAIMNQTAEDIQRIVDEFPGGVDMYAWLYQVAIGYKTGGRPRRSYSGPSSGPANASVQGSLTAGSIAGIVVGVAGGLLALLGCLFLCYSCRMTRHHRTLLGKARPPGLGQHTTLLVTDVQGSTQLWDALAPGVMEHSIALHYSILRKIAAEHSGHESATEGDSIVLGFHTPQAAVEAALDAQLALLHADWPEELLEHPLCAPQCVAATDGLRALSTWGSFKAERTYSGWPPQGLPPFPLWDFAGTTGMSGTASALWQEPPPPSSLSVRFSQLSHSLRLGSVRHSGTAQLARPWGAGRAANRAAGRGGTGPQPGSLREWFAWARSRLAFWHMRRRLRQLPTPMGLEGVGGSLSNSLGQLVSQAGGAAGAALSRMVQGQPALASGVDMGSESPVSVAATSVAQFLASLVTVVDPSTNPNNNPGSNRNTGSTVVSGLGDWGRHASADGMPLLHSQLLYRGLRVRMGMHTGLFEPSCVVTNPRTHRVQYGGRPLAVASAVSAIGHGGMVLMTGDTFSLIQDQVWDDVLLACHGQQRLKDVDGKVCVYQAWSQALVYRACLPGGASLRHSRQVSPSFLDAPFQLVTVCFLSAVGVNALNSWSREITEASLKLYQQVASAELDKWGGYFVNGSSSLVVAAFIQPAHAIRWALSTIRACLEADWDPALLEHELGEEVIVGNNLDLTRSLSYELWAGAEAGNTALTTYTHAAIMARATHALEAAHAAGMPSAGGFSGGGVAHAGHVHTTLPPGPVSEPHGVTSDRDRVVLSGTANTVPELVSGHTAVSTVVSRSPLAMGLNFEERTTTLGPRAAVAQRTMLFRGLRLKCSVDVGQARGVIDPSTGHIMFFGRLMNRAARIQGMTKSGQVWCTQEVWDMALPTINANVVPRGVGAASEVGVGGLPGPAPRPSLTATTETPTHYPSPITHYPSSRQLASAPLQRSGTRGPGSLDPISSSSSKPAGTVPGSPAGTSSSPAGVGGVRVGSPAGAEASPADTSAPASPHLSWPLLPPQPQLQQLQDLQACEQRQDSLTLPPPPLQLLQQGSTSMPSQKSGLDCDCLTGRGPAAAAAGTTTAAATAAAAAGVPMQEQPATFPIPCAVNLSFSAASPTQPSSLVTCAPSPPAKSPGTSTQLPSPAGCAEALSSGMALGALSAAGGMEGVLQPHIFATRPATIPARTPGTMPASSSGSMRPNVGRLVAALSHAAAHPKRALEFSGVAPNPAPRPGPLGALPLQPQLAGGTAGGCVSAASHQQRQQEGPGMAVVDEASTQHVSITVGDVVPICEVAPQPAGMPPPQALTQPQQSAAAAAGAAADAVRQQQLPLQLQQARLPPRTSDYGDATVVLRVQPPPAIAAAAAAAPAAAAAGPSALYGSCQKLAPARAAAVVAAAAAAAAGSLSPHVLDRLPVSQQQQQGDLPGDLRQQQRDGGHQRQHAGLEQQQQGDLRQGQQQHQLQQPGQQLQQQQEAGEPQQPQCQWSGFASVGPSAPQAATPGGPGSGQSTQSASTSSSTEPGGGLQQGAHRLGPATSSSTDGEGAPAFGGPTLPLAPKDSLPYSRSREGVPQVASRDNLPLMGSREGLGHRDWRDGGLRRQAGAGTQAHAAAARMAAASSTQYTSQHTQHTGAESGHQRRHSMQEPHSTLLVAGIPLGLRKLRGIQEEVALVHVRFDDQAVVPVVKNSGPAPPPPAELDPQATLGSQEHPSQAIFEALGEPADPPGSMMGQEEAPEPTLGSFAQHAVDLLPRAPPLLPEPARARSMHSLPAAARSVLSVQLARHSMHSVQLAGRSTLNVQGEGQGHGAQHPSWHAL